MVFILQKYFSTFFGVEKVIRDNVSYSGQVNATVKIYIDDEVCYEKTNIKWESNMIYLAIKVPENSKTLKIEVIDSTGQGGIGFGDSKFYI